ncbi:hypothetical protein ACJX0J_014443, partial [Zea mays]
MGKKKIMEEMFQIVGKAMPNGYKRTPASGLGAKRKALPNLSRGRLVQTELHLTWGELQ